MMQTLTLESVFMRPEVKSHFAIKNVLITLLFIAGKMKCNFISGVVRVK